MKFIIYEVTSGWMGTRDGDFYFRSNFQVKEFGCKDGSDFIKVSSKTLDALEIFRNVLHLPVIITSAYRALYYNRVKVKSSDTSQHVKGTAVDIDYTWEMKMLYSPEKIIDIAVSCGFTGIGYYDYWEDGKHINFFHFDTREVKEPVIWKEVF